MSNFPENRAATAAHFPPARMSAIQARYDAQRIAFGPVIFQCVHLAWKRGLLEALMQAGKAGMTSEALAAHCGLSVYGVGVLLETAMSARVVALDDSGHWALGKIGHMFLGDRMTQINFDFVQDVCYKGLADLEASLEQGKPLGLRVLGDWETIYQGLSILPEPARTSWFDFDHFYSDSAFPAALPHALATRPERLMDIGANTGKWTRMCLQRDPALIVTMLDLPVQLDVARQTLADAGLSARAIEHPIDLLDETAAFPPGQDVVWMSQFLCCFSEENIRSILCRARACLAEGGRVLVMDTFWDRQSHELAAYCLINTSPYFTTMASGNSKMYASGAFIACAQAVGLRLVDIRDGLGICHSILIFEAA